MEWAATKEMLELLRLRAELLAILRGPDADQRLARWLLLRQSIAGAATNPAPASDSPRLGDRV